MVPPPALRLHVAEVPLHAVEPPRRHLDRGRRERVAGHVQAAKELERRQLLRKPLQQVVGQQQLLEVGHGLAGLGRQLQEVIVPEVEVLFVVFLFLLLNRGERG